MVVNTHDMYHTVGHEHLDSLLQWATGEYPASSLNMVECEDGRWFIEIDYGHGFDAIAGISNPKSEPYSAPRFLQNEDDAKVFAIDCIKTIYPSLIERDLHQYWLDN